MYKASINALIITALTFFLNGCELDILESDNEAEDQPLTLTQEYNSDTATNQFTVKGNGINATYSSTPENSRYNHSTVFQADQRMALFQVYDEDSNHFLYIEDETVITLDQTTAIRDSYMASNKIYAIASINGSDNFVTFNAQGVEIIASNINEDEFKKQGDTYYFTVNNNESNSAEILSFNGIAITNEKTIANSSISSLDTFTDSLMYKLGSTGKIQLDNLESTREIDMTSAYPLASKNGGYVVYNHDWGTPVYKISANSDTPVAMNLHVPQPELNGTKSLFWAKTHFSNVNHGAIYQFDGTDANAVLTEIDGSLLKSVSSNHVSIDNVLYVVATTVNNARHIISIDSDDAITVEQSLNLNTSPNLINYEGQLHYSLREYLGNSQYEYNIYNLNGELVVTLYRYYEFET